MRLALILVMLLGSVAHADLQIGLDLFQPSVALSPDGSMFAVVHPSVGLQIYDVATARVVARRAETCVAAKDEQCIADLTFSRDGKRLAFAWKKQLRVLEVPSGKVAWTAPVHVYHFSFLDDGRLAVIEADPTYGPDSKIRFYSTKGAPSKLTPVRGAVQWISADGTQAVVSRDEIELVDLSTRATIPLPGGVKIDEHVEWIGRDRWVAKAKSPTTYPDIVTWKKGDRAVTTLATSAKGDDVHGFSVPPPYDRIYVFSSSGLHAFTVDGKQVYGAPWFGGLTQNAVGRSGEAITVLSENDCITRLDAKGAPVLGPTLCGHRPSMLAFDGANLVAKPWMHGIAMTYDAKTGALVAAQPLEDLQPADAATLAMLARDPALIAKVTRALQLPGVNAGELSLSSDGKRLFVLRGAGSSGASIIDLSTNKARTKLDQLLPSGDGKRYAIEHEGSSYKADVRTVEGDKLLGTYDVPQFVGMELSHDGSLLAMDAGGQGKAIEVLDVSSGKLVFTAKCKTTYTAHLALTPDNRFLACTTDKTVEVHDLRTKKLVKSIPHPPGSVDALALSPDGKRVAYGMGHIVIVDL